MSNRRPSSLASPRLALVLDMEEPPTPRPGGCSGRRPRIDSDHVRTTLSGALRGFTFGSDVSDGTCSAPPYNRARRSAIPSHCLRMLFTQRFAEEGAQFWAQRSDAPGFFSWFRRYLLEQPPPTNLLVFHPIG